MSFFVLSVWMEAVHFETPFENLDEKRTIQTSDFRSQIAFMEVIEHSEITM